MLWDSRRLLRSASFSKLTFDLMVWLLGQKIPVPVLMKSHQNVVSSTFQAPSMKSRASLDRDTLKCGGLPCLGTLLTMAIYTVWSSLPVRKQAQKDEEL